MWLLKNKLGLPLDNDPPRPAIWFDVEGCHAPTTLLAIADKHWSKQAQRQTDHINELNFADSPACETMLRLLQTMFVEI